jgi:hypothetical protein
MGGAPPAGVGGPVAWAARLDGDHHPQAFVPRIGDVPLWKLRPVAIDHLYRRWRSDGMAGSSVRRLHNLLHSALGQAVRLRYDVRYREPGRKAR